MASHTRSIHLQFDSDLIFRFRSVDRVLKDRELEDQYIYFAPPDELNDPVEGIRNVVWCGDSIVWERFLEHYLRCLQVFFLHWLTVGERVSLSINDIRVKRTLRDSYFIPDLEKVHRRLREMTFKSLDVSYLLFRLADKPWNREWLVFFLEIIHNYAFDCLGNLLRELGFPAEQRQPKATKRNFWKILFDQIDDASRDSADSALQIAANNRRELAFELSAAADEAQSGTNLVTILLDFPALYLRRIETLLFPIPHVACFSESHHNSSMWGHYGDSHRGVCLIFKTQQNNRGAMCLPLLNPRDHTHRQFLPCRSVSYVSTKPEIDFFRNIGTIPVTQIREDWFTGFAGALSSYANHLSDESARIKHLESLFDADVATKSIDWEYEKEVRLLAPVDEGSHLRLGIKKWRFDFKSLYGIIFGMNVSRGDMQAIIRTVDSLRKQTGHERVFYYNAYYDFASGRVDCRRAGAAIINLSSFIASP